MGHEDVPRITSRIDSFRVRYDLALAIRATIQKDAQATEHLASDGNDPVDPVVMPLRESPGGSEVRDEGHAGLPLADNPRGVAREEPVTWSSNSISAGSSSSSCARSSRLVFLARTVSILSYQFTRNLSSRQRSSCSWQEPPHASDHHQALDVDVRRGWGDVAVYVRGILGTGGFDSDGFVSPNGFFAE